MLRYTGIEPRVVCSPPTSNSDTLAIRELYLSEWQTIHASRHVSMCIQTKLLCELYAFIIRQSIANELHLLV